MPRGRPPKPPSDDPRKQRERELAAIRKQRQRARHHRPEDFRQEEERLINPILTFTELAQPPPTPDHLGLRLEGLTLDSFVDSSSTVVHPSIESSRALDPSYEESSNEFFTFY